MIMTLPYAFVLVFLFSDQICGTGIYQLETRLIYMSLDAHAVFNLKKFEHPDL